MNQPTKAGALTLALSLMMAFAQAADSPLELDSRRKALDTLLKQQWEYTMRKSPEYASILGDKRYNDQLGDLSPKAMEDDVKQSAAFLKQFEAIDTSGFPVQEQLNKDLMVRSLRMEVEGARFKDWQMPVLQNSGIHIDAPQLVSMLSFTSVKDYEDYISRLKKLPLAFTQTRQLMQNGMRERTMPPKFLIPKIAEQSRALGRQKAEDSPFAQPLKQFPKDFSDADKKRLSAAVLGAVRNDVLPAYRKFADFVQVKYAPHGRTEPGLWSLPDGGARYAFRVKASTTTEQTPDEIHRLGLSEVARIEGEMLKVAQRLGHKDLKSLNAAMAKNPDLHPKSRQEIIDLYQKYTDQMYPKLPQLFGILPKAKVEILQIEQFREKGASGAQYNPAAADGSRPGRVMVNTGDFAKRSTSTIETTALHEGVPGHHMQIAIAQEIAGLPMFRQQGNYTSYAEGWALYSERLGSELGFFSDPYSYYGHLQDEMLRAIRLVVDTGLHHKKWSRQQVVDFFHDHSGIEEVEVQSETDRYIVWPGQALGYKVGQLKILALRDYAKTELGSAFDLRAFHDQVLGAGPLPMDVLEARIKTWVASLKKV